MAAMGTGSPSQTTDTSTTRGARGPHLHILLYHTRELVPPTGPVSATFARLSQSDTNLQTLLEHKTLHIDRDSPSLSDVDTVVPCRQSYAVDGDSEIPAVRSGTGCMASLTPLPRKLSFPP